METRTVLSAVPFTTPPAISSALAGAVAVTSGDVDGDGDVDIIGAFYGADTTAWFENTAGDGSAWTQHTIPGFLKEASSVAVGDIDNDGDLDVIAAASDATSDKVAWFRNLDGVGGAWSQVVIAPGTSVNRPRSVSVADLDRDGDLDVLTASSDDDTIAWHENTAGDGTAWTQHVISTTADGAFAVTTADVDRDGDLDVLSASTLDNRVTWYENDGSLSFTEHDISTTSLGAISVLADDFDGDGDIDVLAGSRDDDTIAWFENDGSQSFTPHVVDSSADAISSVARADVDSDGDIDFLSASRYDHKVTWYDNDGSQNFTARSITSAATGAIAVMAADVDSDGDADVVAAAFLDNKINWYRNDSIHRNAVFSAQTALSTTAMGAFSVLDVDLDRDGDVDVLVASRDDNSVTWYENDGSQNFTAHVISAARPGASSVFAADLDSDGDVDVLVASTFDDTVAWYENDGAQSFTEHVLNNTAAGAACVLAADLDDDTDLDILAASTFDNTVAWYENLGGGTFAVPVAITSTTLGPKDLAVGDIDGDGDTDLLVAFYTGNEIAWFANDGAGNFGSKLSISTTANGAQAVKLADLDGDGDLDVAAIAFTDNKLAWFANSGSSTFGSEQVISTAFSGVHGLAVGDLDNDGDLDLATASVTDNTLAWFENNGNGTFAGIDSISTSAIQVRSVVISDVDGDGDADLLYASSGDNTVGRFDNVGGQFGLVTTDTAPASMIEGDVDDVLKIVMTHNGRFGDNVAELATLQLLLEETAGDPLTTAEANLLIDKVFIYRDNNFNGIFETGLDTLVATLTDFTLTNGEQTVSISDGDPNAQVAFGAPATFFVVVDIAGTASEQTPNQFRVTHIASGATTSTAEDATADTPLTLELSANIASAVVTATNNLPPTASAGGPYTIAEGDVLGLDASASSDPETDTLTYSWDINGDGIYGDATGVTPALTWAQLQSLVPAVNDGPATFNVTVEVSDGRNDPVVSAGVLLTVNNANPDAAIENSGPIGEGASASVTFKNQTDPSTADTVAGFKYSYDFNNDGTWDVGDGTYLGSVIENSQTVPTTFLDDNPSVVVRAWILDKDGGFLELMTTIVINNVTPSANLTNSGAVDEHTVATVTFDSQFDPSNADTTAGFHYSYDFNNDGVYEIGDGLTYAGSVLNASQEVPAEFLDDNPSRVVRARIFDKDGGFAERVTIISINSIAPSANFGNNSPKGENQAILFSFTNQTDPSTADTNAGFKYSYDWNNDGDFEDAGEFVDVTDASKTHTFPAEGTYTVRGRIEDKDGEGTEYTTIVTVENADIFVSGFDKGGQPWVHVFDSNTGAEKFSFLAYHQSFKGGVRVAVGDVNADGVPDIITAPGSGGKVVNGTRSIRVFSGVDGVALPSALGTGFTPFGLNFAKGINIAAGDFNLDGKTDIVCAPSNGAKPRILVISGADGQTVLRDIPAAFDNTNAYRKGVRVAVGDVSGDGKLDIIATAGSGLKQLVRVFDGVTGNQLGGTIGSFNPFADRAGITGQLFIAAGDIDEDGKADILVTAATDTVILRVFSGADGTKIGEALNDKLHAECGVYVATADAEGDGDVDIIIGSRKCPGLTPFVAVLDATDFSEIDKFDADDTHAFLGGVWVAGGR